MGGKAEMLYRRALHSRSISHSGASPGRPQDAHGELGQLRVLQASMATLIDHSREAHADVKSLGVAETLLRETLALPGPCAGVVLLASERMANALTALHQLVKHVVRALTVLKPMYRIEDTAVTG